MGPNETRLYEKTMVTSGGKLTINIKAKFEEKFHIYVNDKLVLSNEN